jgi:hypothetical protein
VKQFSVVQLNEFIVSVVQERNVGILVSITMLADVDRIIGSPTDPETHRF